MSTDLGKKDNKKHPKEKPISLYPLTMDEALKEILQVKPPPEGWDKKANKVKPKK